MYFTQSYLAVQGEFWVTTILFRQESEEVKKEATTIGHFLNPDQWIKNYISKEMHDPDMDMWS